MPRMLTTLTAMLALLLCITAASARDNDRPKPEPVTGTFHLGVKAIAVVDAPNATERQTHRFRGRGIAIARPNAVAMSFTVLHPGETADEDETPPEAAEGDGPRVVVHFDDLLRRSKRLNGKLFRGTGLATVYINGERHRVPLTVTGSISRGGDNRPAVISGRFLARERIDGFRFHGSFKGVKVGPATSGEPDLDDLPEQE